MTAKLLAVVCVVCVLGCCQPGAAFYPGMDDTDFMKDDAKAKADMDRMMLMNTEDPKLRAEAEEAFKEIMAAKRLSKLQECRRHCVNEHEDAGEFRSCNAVCEATHKPGVYGELPDLRGEDDASATAPPTPQTAAPTAEPTPEAPAAEQAKSAEL